MKREVRPVSGRVSRNSAEKLRLGTRPGTASSPVLRSAREAPLGPGPSASPWPDDREHLGACCIGGRPDVASAKPVRLAAGNGGVRLHQGHGASKKLARRPALIGSTSVFAEHEVSPRVDKTIDADLPRRVGGGISR